MVVLARICMLFMEHNHLPDDVAGILARPSTSTNWRKGIVEHVSDKTPNQLPTQTRGVAQGAPSRSKCPKQKARKLYKVEELARITILLSQLLHNNLRFPIWSRSLHGSRVVEKNSPVSTPDKLRIDRADQQRTNRQLTDN